MDYLGLFCLGAFVGTIATLGLRHIKNIDEWQKALAAVLPAVLSGVAMVTVDRFKNSAAFGAYPLGLVAALMWAYIDVAITNITGLPKAGITDSGNIQSTEASPWVRRWQIIIGLGHLGSAASITLAAAVLCIIPAACQIQAEMTIKPEKRAELILNSYRQAGANDPPSDARSNPPAAGAPISAAHQSSNP